MAPPAFLPTEQDTMVIKKMEMVRIWRIINEFLMKVGDFWMIFCSSGEAFGDPAEKPEFFDHIKKKICCFAV